MSPELRPVRTVVGTLAGGVVGLLLLGALAGYVIGPMLDLEGLATLLPPLLGGIVGAILGASLGVAFALRDEPGRQQVITVATMLVPALVLLAGAGAEVIDVMVVHPLVLAVLLPVLSLLGRYLATRGDGQGDQAHQRRQPADQRLDTDGAARSR